MTDKTWIKARDIAQMLDQSVATFRRKLDHLIEDEAFPMPSPHSLSPLMWRRTAVLAWIENQCAAKDAHNAASGIRHGRGGNVHLLRLAGSTT